MWAAVADAAEMAGMVALGVGRAQADLDLDACGTELGVALPRDLGIGILNRRHDAADAGGDDRIGAGRRLADMRARFQGHVEGRAFRRLAGAPERLGLGMR